jgi:hypothetical protein
VESHSGFQTWQLGGGYCSNEVHGSYGVSLWKNISTGWESFLFIPDLKWEMLPKLDYGMKSGMGIKTLRIFSRICIVLLV